MPPTILQKIKNYKIKEITNLKKKFGFKQLEKEAFSMSPPLGFLSNLLNKKFPNINIIAEIKKASPSKGLICKNFDPAIIAKSYEEAGATCISVLTDFPSFQGSSKDLKIAKKNSSLPFLRKDFIFDEIQVLESRAMGADCILIIMAALSNTEAKKIEKKAFELNMDVILEVHNLEELSRALSLQSKLIGINNRDLNTFHTNINTTKHLQQYVPNGYHVISESGIFSKKEINSIYEHKINSFLIGETFMRSNNIKNEFNKLLKI